MDKSIEEIERLRVKAANIIKTGSIISVSLSVLIAILTIISGIIPSIIAGKKDPVKALMHQ